MLMLRKCPAGVYLMTLRKPNLQDPNASTLAAKGKVLLVLGWYLREGHVQANASLQIRFIQSPHWIVTLTSLVSRSGASAGEAYDSIAR